MKKSNLVVKMMAICTLLFSINTQAQDSISVLFVGNSYTYVNDLPNVFKQLTGSLGDEATVDSKTNGGFTFQNHLVDPVTMTKIHAKPWDYVILQGQSQEPSFPFGQVNANTLPPAVALADSVYANSFCGQAMYFMTWGRQVGDPQWDSINTFYKMNNRLRNAYVRIADSANASVAPVGVAWKYIIDNHPTINLYSPDGSHPSLEGTYLAACTFYASVYRKNSTGATYTAGLNPTVAGILQSAADLSVLDSIDTWFLKGKADLTVADFLASVNGQTVQLTNTSEHAQSYVWNFGDGASSVLVDPTHGFTADGTYPVELIALSECGNDTTVQQITIQSAGIIEGNALGLTVKMLGNGSFELEFMEIPTCLTIRDMNGAVVLTIKPEQTNVHIDLTAVSAGIYQVEWESDAGKNRYALPVLK
ncbi:MAG: PKD domain-containing protein [Flavobacteriia bacterium]|jgi:PKD repeat protein